VRNTCALIYRAQAFNWVELPRNVLLVKKQGDTRVNQAFQGITSHIRQAFPHMNILVEEQVAQEMSPIIPDLISVQSGKNVQMSV